MADCDGRCSMADGREEVDGWQMAVDRKKQGIVLGLNPFMLTTKISGIK